MGPTIPARGLRHPHGNKSRPAEDHVRPDALFFAVIDGSEITDLLMAPPAPVHLSELVMAKGDAIIVA